MLLEPDALAAALPGLLSALSPVLAPAAALEIRLGGVGADDSISSALTVAGFTDIKSDAETVCARSFDFTDWTGRGRRRASA